MIVIYLGRDCTLIRTIFIQTRFSKSMVGELSEDGKYVWDGTNWIPVSPASNKLDGMKDSVIAGDVVSNTNINSADAEVIKAAMDGVVAALSEMNQSKEEQNNLAKQNIETHDNSNQEIIELEESPFVQSVIYDPEFIIGLIVAISSLFFLGHTTAIPLPSSWASDAIYLDTTLSLACIGGGIMADSFKRKLKDADEIAISKLLQNESTNPTKLNFEISNISDDGGYSSKNQELRIERKDADKWHQDQPLPEIIYNPNIDQNLKTVIDAMNLFSKTHSEFPSSINLDKLDDESIKILSDLWVSLVKEITDAKKQDKNEIILGLASLSVIVIVIGIISYFIF